MDSGIAKVGCDRIPSVDGMNALEVLRYLVKSFVPPDTLPTVRSAANRIFQPVFIVVQILQGDGLRADVPPAERVLLVTADVQAWFSPPASCSCRLLLISMPHIASQRLQLR